MGDMTLLELLQGAGSAASLLLPVIGWFYLEERKERKDKEAKYDALVNRLLRKEGIDV